MLNKWLRRVLGLPPAVIVIESNPTDKEYLSRKGSIEYRLQVAHQALDETGVDLHVWMTANEGGSEGGDDEVA